MDRTDPSREELVGALVNLQRLNQHFGSHRTIRHFLKRWLKPGENRSILAACTGFGDIPRLIVEWARQKGSQAKVLALDMQPATVDSARRRSARSPEICYAQRAIRSLAPSERVEMVLWWLSPHHLV